MKKRRRHHSHKTCINHTKTAYLDIFRRKWFHVFCCNCFFLALVFAAVDRALGFFVCRDLENWKRHLICWIHNGNTFFLFVIFAYGWWWRERRSSQNILSEIYIEIMSIDECVKWCWIYKVICANSIRLHLLLQCVRICLLGNIHWVWERVYRVRDVSMWFTSHQIWYDFQYNFMLCVFLFFFVRE